MAGLDLLARAVKGCSLDDVRVLLEFRKAREELRKLGPGNGLEELQYALPAEKLGVTPAHVRELVETFIYDKPLRFIKVVSDGRIAPALDRLRDKNYRLGVFSDYPAGFKLDAMGINRSVFDVIGHSTMPEIDAFKPNPAGFLYCAAGMALEPSQVLYVGDRENIDMKGARRAGMRGALVAGSFGTGKRGEFMVTKDIVTLEEAMPGVMEG